MQIEKCIGAGQNWGDVFIHFEPILNLSTWKTRQQRNAARVKTDMAYVRDG